MTSYKTELRLLQNNLENKTENLYWKIKEGSQQELFESFNRLALLAHSSRRLNVQE